jgi:formylglycine-generating enzyme required for sulfatase activity
MGVKGSDYRSLETWKDGDENDDYAAPRITYHEIRGENSLWPIRTVEEGCFLYNLRKKTNIWTFDLPSEAQWEYACRAGTTTQYNHGTDVWDDRYNERPWRHSRVGIKLPNAWGLYDFASGGVEWCGDYWTWNLGTDPVIDPMGSPTSEFNVTRGNRVVSNSRIEAQPIFGGNDVSEQSFRVAVQLD